MLRPRFVPYLVGLAAILVSIAALLTIAHEVRDWRGDHRGRDDQRHGDRWQRPDDRRGSNRDGRDGRQGPGARGGEGSDYFGQPGMPGGPPQGPPRAHHRAPPRAHHRAPPQGPPQGAPGLPPGAPYLGVNVEPAEGGAAVRAVAPNSPAAAAGVRDGDLIVRAAGKDVRDIEALRGALAVPKPGERYELVVKRDGTDQTLTVQAATVPQPPREFRPGDPAPAAPAPTRS
ncbi:MAG: PDZ domain-containing protein [Chloroflexi bacterium]|nr:MAG: PDZ domain-containing protein [Chloroflexota bacterium]